MYKFVTLFLCLCFSVEATKIERENFYLNGTFFCNKKIMENYTFVISESNLFQTNPKKENPKHISLFEGKEKFYFTISHTCGAELLPKCSFFDTIVLKNPVEKKMENLKGENHVINLKHDVEIDFYDFQELIKKNSNDYKRKLVCK
uniref:ZP domain-containing protein n=1 Tax=Strongyloides stercoralis TaxID=6248 RepID=A0A0K0EB03_STRER